jgi:hypothetical protein
LPLDPDEAGNLKSDLGKPALYPLRVSVGRMSQKSSPFYGVGV